MSDNIQHLEVYLDREKVIEEGFRLMSMIRPEWPRDSIKHKPMTAGYINSMNMYYMDSEREAEGIVVRVYSSMATDVLRRDLEFFTMQLAAHVGSFPPVVAVFSNGVAYKYAPGRNLVWKDYLNPVILRSVARSLAQLHYVDYKQTPLIDLNGKTTFYPWDGELQLYSFLRDITVQIPEKLTNKEKDEIYQSINITKAQWIEELNWMVESIDDLDAHRCPCNLDPHIMNTVYDDKTEKTCIVDYDIGIMAFAMLDLSYPLTLFLVKNYVGWEWEDDPKELNTPDVKRQLVTAYLERKHELLGHNSDTVVTDIEVELALVELHIFYIINFFRFSLGLLCIVDDDVQFDILGVVKTFAELYRKQKNELAGLKEEHANLKKKMMAGGKP